VSRLIGLLLLIFAGLLAGCDQIRSLLPANEAPPASSLKREELLKAVLFNSPTKDARSMRIKVRSGTNELDGMASINPIHVIQLDAEQAVLITENKELFINKDNISTETGCHACSVWVGAYFFLKNKNTQWELTHRVDGHDYIGVFGSIGASYVHKLASQKYAVSVKNDSCWQGYCGEWLSIYGFEQSKIITLLPTLWISTSSLGSGYQDCESVKAAYQDKQDLVPKPTSALETSVNLHCFETKSTYKFSINQQLEPQLVIVYSGFKSEWKENDVTVPVRRINQRSVYTLKNNRFELTSGNNPVEKI
jgi:hypothetical protein